MSVMLYVVEGNNQQWSKMDYESTNYHPAFPIHNCKSRCRHGFTVVERKKKEKKNYHS